MSIVRWLLKRPVKVSFAVLLLVTISFAAHWWFLPSIPDVSAEDVEAIEVSLNLYENHSDPMGCQKMARVSSKDTQAIKSFLDSIRNAQRTSEHKCGNSGTIKIHLKSGSMEMVEILPGHDPAFYEYRYGSRINRVERQVFLSALKTMGVENLKLLPPS